MPVDSDFIVLVAGYCLNYSFKEATRTVKSVPTVGEVLLFVLLYNYDVADLASTRHQQRHHFRRVTTKLVHHVDTVVCRRHVEIFLKDVNFVRNYRI